jgi:primosomal replication protein N
VNSPALRVTPAGTAVLSLIVDCGAQVGELMMPVVMTGESARAIASRLKDGIEVEVHGSMRRLQSRSGIGAASLGVEVVANDLKIVEETTSNSIGKLSNG